MGCNERFEVRIIVSEMTAGQSTGPHASSATVRALAEFTERYSAAILVATVIITIVAVVRLPLPYDDDVIRFLPQGHAEVIRLQSMADRFGSIHVALVGVETPDLFTHDRLKFVRELTMALRAVPEVSFVTSLTELAVVDTRGGGAGGTEGESVHRELVPPQIPESTAALKTLKDDVLKLDYLVGSLVSGDGTSTLLVMQLHDKLDGERVSTTAAALKLKQVAAKVAPASDVRLHFGGAPFIAEAAANGSQADLLRLAPWVCGIIVLLIFFSLGSARAALLALGSVGLGIVWTMGLMGWIGAPLTLVSTSLPVILTALGSAYAVHLLVCYLDHPPSISGMLSRVGWPVAIAGLTTMAGFISFLVMDLAPMREFGWQMAAGTGICGVVALIVIPAVLARWPITARRNSRAASRLDEWLVRLALSSRRRRAHLLLGAGLIAVFFGWHLQGVETRMDTRSFFEEDSDPDLADRFMAE
ncbi:MAG: putative RND superfamily exporter protein, partial [Myxococcota bacterium]